MHGGRNRQSAAAERSDIVLQRGHDVLPSGIDQTCVHPEAELPPVLGFGLNDSVQQDAKAPNLGTHQRHRKCLLRELPFRVVTGPRPTSRAPLRAARTGV